MTEKEQREMAQQIADGSKAFDFDLALELVQLRPADAEKILRMREETEEKIERLRRAHEGLHRAALAYARPRRVLARR
jgi:hypothetical protein